MHFVGHFYHHLQCSRSSLSSPCTDTCCFSYCLMLPSPTGDSGITQTPRYRITQTARKMILECSQNMGHYWMFWYRQDVGQGLKLIYYSGSIGSTTKGDVPEGYSVSRNETQRFPLILESTSPKQTSMYFCASSEHSTTHPGAACTRRTTRWKWALLLQPLPHAKEKSALPEAPLSNRISARGSLGSMNLSVS